jgi:hypothetical protein
VADAMRNIFTKTGRQPLKMNGDGGREFVNIRFKKLLKEFGVDYFISYGEVKAAIAERFIRTLKTHIWKYFKHFNTWRYIDVLQDFIVAYNNSVNRTIGVAPSNVTLNKTFSIWKRAFNPLNQRLRSQVKRPKFKINDIVRISSVKGAFEKGYVGMFREDYFVVDRVINYKYPFGYKLKEFDTGEPIFGVFYEPELQKIIFSKNQPAEKTFDVEKVLKTQKIGRTNYSFVKFVGFPAKYNRWIPNTNIRKK